MKRWRHLLVMTLALAAIGMARAEEIAAVAWKVPLDPLVSALKTDPSLPETGELEKAPWPSVFFQEGDSLVDLSAAFDRYEAVLQTWLSGADQISEAKPSDRPWIVWNERTGLLVSQRADWSGILAVEEILGLQGYAPGPASPHKGLTAEISGRNGQPARSVAIQIGDSPGEVSKDGVTLKAESSVGSHSISLLVQWKDEGHQWTYEGSFAPARGTPLTIARSGTGKDAWTLKATVEPVNPDGSPFTGARLIEKAGAISEQRTPGPALLRETLDETRILTVFTLPRFGERGLGFGRPILKLTPELAAIIGSETLYDTTSVLEEKGVPVDRSRGFFVAFDLGSNLYVMGDEALIKTVKDLVAESLATPDPMIRIETNENAGGWGVICPPSEKAAITRTTDGKEDQKFIVETVLAADRNSVRLFYELDYSSAESPPLSLASDITLIPGEPLEIGSYTKDGISKPLTVTTNVVTPESHD